MNEIINEPKVKSLFTQMIYQSHFAEINGHTAILMVVEGKSDEIIAENFNGKIFPFLLDPIIPIQLVIGYKRI